MVITVEQAQKLKNDFKKQRIEPEKQKVLTQFIDEAKEYAIEHNQRDYFPKENITQSLAKIKTEYQNEYDSYIEHGYPEWAEKIKVFLDYCIELEKYNE